MSASLEEELSAALDMASEFVQPRPGLADRARRAARRRRHRSLVAAAACGLALVAASASYVALGRHQSAPDANRRGHQAPRTLIVGRASAGQLAVGGQYIYAITSPPFQLGAYDRTSGKLIRQVRIPNVPFALAVGPGGRVWLSFGHDATGGAAQGTWLLSPDLRLRSASPGAENNIVPTGPTTAQAMTPRGAVEIQMPAPGRPGLATQSPIPSTGIGRSALVIRWAGRLDGRMVADVNINGPNNDILDHLVIVGRPALEFGGGTRFAIQSVASAGGALWAITSSYGRSGPPVGWGPLVRLDRNLHLTTTQSIKASAVLAKATQVWSAGSAIWIATAMPGHWLACFNSDGQPGPVTPVSVGGPVVALAVAGDTVYVSTVQSHAPYVVRSYRVPAVCR